MRPVHCHEALFLAEYYDGSLNVLLIAPHGGSEKPSFIPDRAAGCWNQTTQSCEWIHGCGSVDLTRYYYQCNLFK